MFYSGTWYKNSEEESEILSDKLQELLKQQKELTHQHLHQTETILNREATSAGDDEQFMKENEKRLNEVSAKINVLTNGLQQMGFKLNSTDHPDTIAIDGKITENNIPIFTPNPNINAMLPSRVQSTHFYDSKHNFILHLNDRYESELELIRIRRRKRYRTSVTNRIYHIDPDLSVHDIFKKTDSTQITNNIEHIWVNTIDTALQSHVDGDVFELAEGKHVMSGNYQIYGTLTIRGTASSNWKTLIVNQYDSDHFIWCIGQNSRVTFENLLIRSNGAHCGIVKVSLRAQFIGRKVLFHCNGLEGICVENESKLWLDGCVLLNSVGAGIHINTGCKCLLTQTTIINCGEGDYELVQGQGAIVIYGNDLNYAQHLVRKTPSLRFPSMDNVPGMVLDPDPTLASMLRGRTYLYVQECKIKCNFGFGISFEITPSFNALSVPLIASMMDVSITVRETHFTENTFGNMGKIPAIWTNHNKNGIETLFNQIKRLNPSLFAPFVHETKDENDTDGDHEMKGNNGGEYSQHSAQIMPLTEQALRAQNDDDEEEDEEADDDADNDQILDLEDDSSELRSLRSKSEPATHEIANSEHGNENLNPIKLSDKRERDREFSLGSNSSSKIIKMRQDRGTLRLSAPPPQTHGLLASASPQNDANGSKHEMDDDIDVDADGGDVEEAVDAVVVAVAVAVAVADEEDEDVDVDVDDDIDIKEKPLRRSPRIKEKLQNKIIANQPKQTKAAYTANNKNINHKLRENNSSPITKSKIKKQIKKKNKKRRRFKRQRSKSLQNEINEDENKENDIFVSSQGTPSKRRKLNEDITENGKNYAVDEDSVRFPVRNNNIDNMEDVDMKHGFEAKEITKTLRRSTRKASLRATKNLTKNLIASRKKKKSILSQSIASISNNNNMRNKAKPKPKRRGRRHSASTRR